MSVIPLGTIVPYAGSTYDSLLYDGWLACKGQELDPKSEDYKSLFDAIGTTFGGNGNTSFFLPDLQGLFVRGHSDGSGNDPDADARFASREGGASGDALGSVQVDSTKAPLNSFVADVPHLPDDSHKGNYGSLVGDRYADFNDGSVSVTVAGGDNESRPVNVYVNFVIKFHDYADAPGLPIGGLVAMAGSNAPSLEGAQFVLCDGRQLSNKDRTNKDIYLAIGTANGGDGTPNFNLPDYRGRFLRGVANASTRDPDKDSRTAPHGTSSGNSGNAVGSVQTFATGAPNADFTVSVPNLPKDDSKVDHIAGRSTSMKNDSSARANLASSGGDDETRPVNVYVDWYIRTS